MPEAMTVSVQQDDLRQGAGYAHASEPFTHRKLDQQKSRHARAPNLARITAHRVARSVVARVLSDSGIPCICDESDHTQTTEFCIRVDSGHYIQVRFISNRPNYRKLLEDVWSFNHRPHHYYVATTSRDELQSLDMLGYATRAEMAERVPVSHGQGRSSYYVYLTDLHPFGQLVTALHAELQHVKVIP